MDSKRYMISDAAKMVDVESHVLRYWEEELALPIERNEMGHRCYTEDNIQVFQQIKDLKEQGLQLKTIKTLLPDAESENIPPTVIQETPPGHDKMEQFQLILGKVVAQAIHESQKEMGKELSHQVSTQVVKEMDYLFRLQEERDETHYKKLDELIRSSQKQRKSFAIHKKTEKIPKEPKIKEVNIQKKKLAKIKETQKKSWFFHAKKDIVL